MAQRYVVPGWFTRNVFNRVVAALTRLGISVWGSRLLEVRGRKSGQPRRTPVNLLTLDGAKYLVAPRGHTQWVRNLRAAGEGELLLGRQRERFAGVEIADDRKEPILREYLKRWKWKVGQFFGGVDADAPEEDLRRIAPDNPIFRPRDGSGPGRIPTGSGPPGAQGRRRSGSRTGATPGSSQTTSADTSGRSRINRSGPRNSSPAPPAPTVHPCLPAPMLLVAADAGGDDQDRE